MSGETPEWDRDLTRAEVRRLAPRARGARVKAALERKVAALERRAAVGKHPSDVAFVPKTRAALRRWKDIEHRLWDWAWPILDSFDGPNADLMARYRAALTHILRSPKASRDRASAEAAGKDQLIARLRRQNEQLVEEVRALQRRLMDPPLERR